jgi:hypothetical protein
MRMQGGEGNPVTTTITLSSRYAPFMTNQDQQAIETIANQMENRARMMSMGGLSYRQLAARNNPYGRGIYKPGPLLPNGKPNRALRRRAIGRLRGQRKGVSNMAIVNRHSGDFYRSWESSVTFTSKGATVSLTNTSENAGYLAFGTKTMRAHGPFTTVPALYAEPLNRLWRARAQAAYMRVAAGGGASNAN